MIFNKDEARIHFELNRASQEQNKTLFDLLHVRRAELEGVFGEALHWRRMDDKKVSVIGCGKSFDGHNRANWPAMISWLVAHLQRMEKTFSPQVPVLRATLRQMPDGNAQGIDGEGK